MAYVAAIVATILSLVNFYLLKGMYPMNNKIESVIEFLLVFFMFAVIISTGYHLLND
jgi:hypothetical protein